MTTPNRLNLAYALAGIPAAHQSLGAPDNDKLAQSLMLGGLSTLAIALANVVLRVVDLDEQATRGEPAPTVEVEPGEYFDGDTRPGPNGTRIRSFWGYACELCRIATCGKAFDVHVGEQHDCPAQGAFPERLAEAVHGMLNPAPTPPPGEGSMRNGRDAAFVRAYKHGYHGFVACEHATCVHYRGHAGAHSDGTTREHVSDPAALVPASPPGEDKPTPAPKIHECKVCGAAYAREADYYAHVCGRGDEEEPERDTLKARLEQWELFGAEISGCTNYVGDAALEDARMGMERHILAWRLNADTQRERAEKAERELSEARAALTHEGLTAREWAERWHNSNDCHLVQQHRADAVLKELESQRVASAAVIGLLDERDHARKRANPDCPKCDGDGWSFCDCLPVAALDRAEGEGAEAPPETQVEALKARVAAMSDDKVGELWAKLKAMGDSEPPPEEEKLIAYVRASDGTKTPITPQQWAQAVLAHPKPEAPPVADSSDAGRDIKFGSTWKQAIPPGIHVKVVSVVGGVQYEWRGEKGYDDVSEAEFRMHFAWVSDPETP